MKFTHNGKHLKNDNPYGIEPLQVVLKRVAFEHAKMALDAANGNKQLAAKWLGLSTAGFYRHFITGITHSQRFVVSGHEERKQVRIAKDAAQRWKPIPRNRSLVKHRYHARKVPVSNVNQLLAFFLGRKIRSNRVSFWYENKYELESIYADARRSYLRLIKKIHPDSHPGADGYICQVNAAWARLRRMFHDHGVC